MTTKEKYLAILKSPRFHQLAVIALLQALRHYGVIDDFMANLLSGVLAASVTIGTADKANTVSVER